MAFKNIIQGSMASYWRDEFQHVRRRRQSCDLAMYAKQMRRSPSFDSTHQLSRSWVGYKRPLSPAVTSWDHVFVFSALTLLVGQQEGHLVCKN